MKKFYIPAVALMMMFTAVVSAYSAKLNIGDPVPPVRVAKWVKGQPVNSIEKGKVYVFEFWASWCEPCRESIPHITELAQKYKDKVVFAGINVWDTDDVKTQAEYTSKIAAFVKEQGAKMEYNVGLDDLKGRMTETWLNSAGVKGIPTAYVIDKNGRLAAITHPAMLDGILDKVIDGTFDPKAFADKMAQDEKVTQDIYGIYDLLGKEKYSEVVTESDKLLAINPDREIDLVVAKAYGLLFTDETAFYEYAKKSADGCAKNDSRTLAALSAMITGKADLKTPNYNLALALAEKANEITKGEAAFALDTLATAYFKVGNIDKAVSIQEQAVKIASTDKKTPAEYREQMKTRLNDYKKNKG